MANQDKIDRFNKYKSLKDDAAAACIRSFLHLVRPAEGFPRHSVHEIKQAWSNWKDAEEVFWRMTAWDEPLNHVFPTPPPDDAEHKPCRQMWGLLIQEQVERQSFQALLIKNAVAAILASDACLTHPATCSCKVPMNPWTSYDCVMALEPLGLQHSPRCECGGYRICKQQEKQKLLEAEEIAAKMKAATVTAQAEAAANPELHVVPCRCDAQYCNVTCSCLPGRIAEAKAISAAPTVATSAATVVTPVATVVKQSPYDYKHNVDTCACGTCYKSRVDSGTQHLYEKRCKDEAAAVKARLGSKSCSACKASASGSCVDCYANRYSYDASGRLKMPSEIQMLRQAYYMEEQWYMKSRRQKESSTATATASASGSGFGEALKKASTAISVAATKSAVGDDFAKNLFAAMGTPHDSKCPHGLPFYACMPCSH